MRLCIAQRVLPYSPGLLCDRGSESNPSGQDVWAVGGAVLQAEWASGYGADRKVANFVYQDGCNNTCTGLDLDRSFLWGNGLAEQ